MTDTKVKTSPKSNKKIMVVGVGVVAALFVLILITTIGGLALAYNSNKNVPFLSDAVERIENAVVSDEQFSKLVQSSISDNLFSNIEQVSNIDSDEQVINEENLDNVLENDLDADSYRFDADITMESKYSYEGTGTTAEPNDYKYTINVNGDVNGKDKENPAMEIKVDANVLVNGDETTGNGEVIFKDQKVFMILNELKLSNPAVANPFDAYTKKWFSIDTEGEMFKGIVSEQNEVSEEDMKKLKELINSDVVTKNIKRLPDEVINGVRTYCLEFSLDNESAKELGAEISRIYGTPMNENTSEDPGNLVLTACIGRRDNRLYKLTFDMTFDETTSLYKMSSNISMELSISEYNSDFDIKAPEGAQDLIEMIQEQQRKIQQSSMENERRYQEMMEEYEQY